MTECCEPDPMRTRAGRPGGVSTLSECEPEEETTACPHAGATHNGYTVGENCEARGLGSWGYNQASIAIGMIDPENGSGCWELREEMDYILHVAGMYEFWEEPANPDAWYTAITDSTTHQTGINMAWIDGYLPGTTSPEEQFWLSLAHEAAHHLGFGWINDDEAEAFARMCLRLE